MSETLESNEVKISMQKDPLIYLKQGRREARKRGAEERLLDFKEIYAPAEDGQLTRQASRCLDCGNPYCEWKCPLHNYIPNWMELTAANNFDSAAELMHQTNPFPEICGRVCPQDRLCESACTLNDEFGAVTIGAIEKNVADKAMAKNWRPKQTPVTDASPKVAIVGAGPAGLGCAEMLARNGIKAIVFDRYPEIGGLMTFGIPGFKLEKDVIYKRRQYLSDLGVEFRLSTEIGADVSFESLESEHDYVFVATGTYNALDGSLPGKELPGVIQALDYLIGNINQQENFGIEDQYPFQDMAGQRVLVLGGGDTAMDCVRSAVRQKADSVSCVYRRTEKDMPGSKREVANAKEEGVQFIFKRQPIAIEQQGNGLLVKFESTADDKEIIEMQADKVILAFGFRPEQYSWLTQAGVVTDDKGRISTQPTNEPGLEYSQLTSNQKIFAGGDIVRGADLVVTAIAEGRQAAREIIAALQAE